MKKLLKDKRKINIAFIKRGGLGAGGSERWLQFAAITFVKNNYNVDYYYSEDRQDINRIKDLKKNNVNLIPFKIKRIANNSEWIDTDFWKKFDENNYDFISTVMYCSTEYPFNKIKKPIIPALMFGVHVDLTKSILHSFFPSEWLRLKWIKNGGSKLKSSVIPIPIDRPFNTNNFRKKLKIKNSDIVAGFHQRVDNSIFSNIPLNAFKNFDGSDFYFIIMGGSEKYKTQAKALKIKNVIFLPHSSDHSIISQFLNTLNIFAHGRSDGETYGTVFAEALIHGLPCLSHYTGIDDAQKNTMGPHGVFAKNQIEYGQFLEKFFVNKSFRNKLKLNSKNFAKKNYYRPLIEKKIIKSFNNIAYKKRKFYQKHRVLFVLNVFYIRLVKSICIQLSRLLPFSGMRRNFRKFIIHRANFRFINFELY